MNKQRKASIARGEIPDILGDSGTDKLKGSTPSAVWYPTNSIDYGFGASNRARQFELMAVYQRNPMVHGAIDINAKAAVAAKPSVMKVVNKGAKNLSIRGLKRYAKKQYKKLLKQWNDSALSRKAISDDEELVDASDSDFFQVLNSSEWNMDLHGLIRLAVVSICIYGIGFWFKNRDGIGRVTSYQYLPTYNITPIRDEDGRVSSWIYSSTFDGITSKTSIDPEDLVIFKWPSPTDPVASGDSPLLSALRRIDLSGKWLDWQDWLIGNRARPDWCFIPKMPEGGSLDPAQAARTEKRINDKFRGPGNGRVAIVEDAGTIKELNWSPVDLAPLEFDDKLKDAILFALSIPEAFSNNDGNRANLQGSMEQWARQSLAPIICMIEGVLTKEAQAYDPTLIFAFENVIPEDEAFLLEVEKFDLSKWQVALAGGAVDIDEFRVNVLGLEPLPDGAGETLAQDDTIESSESSDEQEEAPEAEQTEDAKPDEQQTETPAKSIDLLTLNKSVADGDIDRATAINLVAYYLNIDDASAKRLVTHPKIKLVNRSIKNKTVSLPPVKMADHKPLMNAVKKQLDKQKAHYLAQCDGVKSWSDITLKDGLHHAFMPIDSWDAQDGMAYKPYIQTSMVETADGRQEALTQVGADPDVFAVVPEQIDKAAAHASLKFAKSTNDTTAKNLNDALSELREEIADGIETGDSIQQMKKRVQSVFESMDSDKAEEIARTETSRAVHEGQKITAKASGVVSGFKFLLSDESCPECQDIADNNPEIDIDGKFDPSDTYSDTPIPVHPNCRCTMQEIIDLDALDKED